MKYLAKLFSFFFILFSLCLWFLLISPTTNVAVYGQESESSINDKISSSQNILYQVFEDGRTRVTHEVRLTNLTTNYYASEYSLLLGFTDLINVAGADSVGSLAIDVTKRETGTEMRISFNEKAVGKGRILSFSLSYDTAEIATKNGRIWEVNIPAISERDELGDYIITLRVPSSFGKASYIKPIPLSSGSSTTLTFAKADAVRGVSVAFGQYQLFDFTLAYHLKNDKLFPIVTEIALPPTTSYQEILLNTLEPAPLTVNQDADGNWLARYRLEASEKIDIKAVGKAKIFAQPQNVMLYTAEKPEEYLGSELYWETQDSAILEKAKELKTPRAIYDYVVQTLSYDVSRIQASVNRVGAKGVLEKPQSAICMEFTDLFIALARAAGIPAREIDGFAFTRNERFRPLSLNQSNDGSKQINGNQDILHAWPQYFDNERKMWIAIDPTWGNTSSIDYFDVFDFNHFAFVVKGADSQYPSPAGSYKEASDLEKKDVEVTFALDDQFKKKENISASFNLPAELVAGFATTTKVILTNEGNTILFPGELVLLTEKLLPRTQSQPAAPIPPFGKLILSAEVKSASYFDHFGTTIKARLNNGEFSHNIGVVPFYLIYLPWIGGGIGGGLCFFAAGVAWRIYIQRQKRHDPLRGQSQQSQTSRFKLPWQKN